MMAGSIRFVLSIFFVSLAKCDEFLEPQEKQLQDDLLHVRNWTVRPVRRWKDRLVVNFRFMLNRVVELDVKDQLLTLNVKIEQEWLDYKLRWDPDSYGGIRQINFPVESLWLPDFKLYNQLGEFEMKGPAAVVRSDGLIRWTPDAILRTFCPIDLRHYPFDIQECDLTFGSWTYDGTQLYIRLKDLPGDTNVTGVLPVGMILKDYYPSSEWDLISIPAEFYIHLYSCCEEPYPVIKFNVTLRRHPNFYLVNLVMPLVGLSYLSLLVFYLPADCNEKITLCVSILTSQVMFLLLMMDNIPVTSLAVPLLGKIIVFNMFLVFLSVLCTTIVLNVHHRKPTTHEIPKWVRRVRYTLIPKLLLVEPPPLPSTGRNESARGGNGLFGGGESGEDWLDSEVRLRKVSHLCSMSLLEADRQLESYNSGVARRHSESGIQKALCNINYVRNHTKRLDEMSDECEDWKFLASILDRFFLILFNIAFIIGTLIIMMDAPALYDRRKAVNKTLTLDIGNTLLPIKDNVAPKNDTEYFLDGNEIFFDE